jgi:hypothetical protein
LAGIAEVGTIRTLSVLPRVLHNSIHLQYVIKSYGSHGSTFARPLLCIKMFQTFGEFPINEKSPSWIRGQLPL